MNKLNGMKIGFAVTGSFCTFSKAFEQMKILKESGAVVIPVMSLSLRIPGLEMQMII